MQKIKEVKGAQVIMGYRNVFKMMGFICTCNFFRLYKSGFTMGDCTCIFYFLSTTFNCEVIIVLFSKFSIC